MAERVRSKKHLDFVRSLPCAICADNVTVEAAHVRFSDRDVAKRQTGMGEKPDDAWTVPLCGSHHREQHDGNERAFWGKHGINPIFLAQAIYRVSGDHDAALQIILHARAA
jgi:Protein of unknown function (DUF968)